MARSGSARRLSPGCIPMPTGRAGPGVSAFGFGGTNFHAVLEAYDRNLVAQPEPTMTRLARANCWSGRPTSRASLSSKLDQLAAGDSTPAHARAL